MSLHNTVAGRLGLAFGGAGLALCGVIVLMGFMLLQSGHSLERFGTEGVHQLRMLAQLEAQAAAQAVIFRDLGLNDDVQVQDKLLAELKRIDTDIQDALQQLKAANPGQDAAWAEGLQALLATSAPVQKKVMAAIDEARFDDLKPLLINEYRPAQLRVAEGLRKASAELSARMLADAQARNHQQRQTLWALAAGAAAVLVAASLGTAWVVMRLSRTLGGEPEAAP
jgi:hypothetical protein